ncbi:TraR/DksA family transcriptional regulator [Ramlibacter sp. G-1-2-2]|uniref:TraR/DksA family transcriptional regulator n=1 Tax=Ramlibacter agri TaxID=2728837 RepID=A0A848HKK8_9BURK|nr:TraR/DksA family transcriptional regulator [Ramlibacter agri]NML48268.1 TraR/DksA family transcriptional regulator [Ramlibacter agri]
MSLATASPDLSLRLLTQMTKRQEELRAMLRAAADARENEQPTDVVDFKDVAAEESRAAVDDLALSHAAIELSQVSSALRRMEEGSYGLCQDCGEAIDERRLMALPATPYCTACQTIHERPAPGRR